LAVDSTRRGFGEPSLAPALDLTQLRHHLLPYAGSAPTSEVSVYGLPRSKVFGQHPPLTPRLIDIQNAVDHAPPITWWTSWATRTPLLHGEERLEHLLLLIRQICFILTTGAHC